MEKKTFVVTHTANHEEGASVRIVDVTDVAELEQYGFEVGIPYQRGLFPYNRNKSKRGFRCIEDMRVGTIIKGEQGAYLQRIA